MSVSSLALLAGASNSVPARALYSPKETEAILNVSHATCYRLIAAGKLDARKLGGKTLITAESIERLIAELPKLGRQG
jgi:excisionase family DNA binding protein